MATVIPTRPLYVRERGRQNWRSSVPRTRIDVSPSPSARGMCEAPARAKQDTLSSAELKTPTSGSTGITQERLDWSARGRPQRAPCFVPSEATERGWRLRHREDDKYRCAGLRETDDGRRRAHRDGGSVGTEGETSGQRARRGVSARREKAASAGPDGTNWAGVGITSHAAICVMVTRGRVFEHALAGVGVW